MNQNIIYPLVFFVIRTVKANKVSLVLSASAISASVLLIMLISGLYHNSKNAFLLDSLNLNGVIGPRGSEIQLVMNSFYHMDVSPGNIPYSFYKRLQKDSRVDISIPLAMGDNYHGYRIIGTESVIFEEEVLSTGKLEFDEGRAFDPNQLEIVVGAQVANQLNIKMGDYLHAFHGLVFDEKMKHKQRYLVTGILSPTQTPMDQVLFIPLDSFYKMDDHKLGDKRFSVDPSTMDVIPDDIKELSSVLVKVKLGSVMTIRTEVNQMGTRATFAFLPAVVPEILKKVGWGVVVLEYVSFLVVVIACMVVLIGIYNSLDQRMQEFAVLRALGCSKKFIFIRLIFEANFVTGIGYMLGIAFYVLSFAFIQNYFYKSTGIFLKFSEIPPIFIGLPYILIVLSSLTALIPAFKIYKSDVTKIL